MVPLRILLLVALTGDALGETRTSASYTIATDVTDSAGGRSSSPLYTNEGSTGGVTGVAALPPFTNTGGFIGQLEEQAGFASWIRSALPAGLPAAQYEGASDYDRDGATNEDEWLALTDPASGSSHFAPTSTGSGGNFLLRFLSASGRTYVLRQSDTLAPGSWTNAPSQPVVIGTGGILSFTVTPAGVRRRFYQIQPALP